MQTFDLQRMVSGDPQNNKEGSATDGTQLRFLGASRQEA